jgi:putative tryptophan/tyrosine transport system substrate-binding protein
MRRRNFIALMGGAAVWPLAAQGQNGPVPVIAVVSARSLEFDRPLLTAFWSGLRELGYEEGRNVAVEYRFASGDYGRIRGLVLDLIGRRVSVFVFLALNNFTGRAVFPELRASRIPVVFSSGSDPVREGIVDNMGRPGGNFTGAFTFVGALTGKILDLLHELVPAAKTFGVIEDAATSRADNDARAAVTSLGAQLVLLKAGSDGEIESSFAALEGARVDAVHIATSPFLVTRGKLLVPRAARSRPPAAYARREFTEAGGLMSYGYDIAEAYRQLGHYTGRILLGTRPADLPVFQPTRIELVVNLRAAKAIGLEVPPLLLARADEVIE